MPRKSLEAAGIIANKNGIPNDPRPPKVTSGLRLGTPALTMPRIEGERHRQGRPFWTGRSVNKSDSAALAKIRQEVAEFCKAFPMPH